MITPSHTRARLAAATAVASVLMVVWPGRAPAHPLGNFTVNRFSGLAISTSEVVVHYVVDLAEIPTFQELRRIDSNGDEAAGEAELAAYAQSLATELVEGLSLSADGRSVELAVEEPSAVLRPGQGGLEVLRFAARFRGSLASPGASLNYRDGNHTSLNELGWREVIAYPVGGQGFASSSVPARSASDELRSYPRDLLASPLDVTSARLELDPGAGSAGGAARSLGERLGSPGAAAGGSFAALIERELSPAFFFVAIGLALGFGAVHALGPGHGKTVMAAYLMGAEGRVKDAVTIGVAVSVMHTASVAALGLVTLAASSLFPPEAVFPWLAVTAGIVVLALGLWLLYVRVRAYASHRRRLVAGGTQGHEPVRRQSELVHAGAGHAHPEGPHEHSEGPHEHSGPHAHSEGPHAHDHVHGHGLDHSDDHPIAAPGAASHSHGGMTHSHALPDAPLWSWKGLAAVALAGGLLPSPTALVVLLGAVALHRVAFGIALVAAFSVGLAAALTVIGIAVIRARGYAARRLGERTAMTLPILSAAAIVAVGLWLTVRAISVF